MRVLLDTNVILDSMLHRAPWHVEADAVLQKAQLGALVCAATSLSLANAFYVGRRVVGAARARAGVRAFLKAFEVLAVDHRTLEDADAFPGSDFEDNIQMAAAVAGSVDAVVTRDAAGFAHSPVPVRSPAELLHHLNPKPPQP